VGSTVGVQIRVVSKSQQSAGCPENKLQEVAHLFHQLGRDDVRQHG
jgi:hypothetical protein